MDDSAISTDSTPDSHYTTITRISSPFWLWFSRVVLVVVLFGTLYMEVTELPNAIDYFQTRAADFDATTAGVYVVGMVGLRVIVSAVLILLGVFLYLRGPDNRMIVLAAVWFIAFGGQGVSFLNAVEDPQAYYGEGLTYLVNNFIGSVAWGLFFIFFWIFPDGRIVPRWGIIGMVFGLFLVVAWAMPPTSPLSPTTWSPLVFVATHLFAVGSILVGMIWRYRRHSSGAQRQQTKWAVFGFVFALVCVMIFNIILPSGLIEAFAIETLGGDISYLLSEIAFVAIPIAVTFALMRSRLWDVDLVINRSLVYGAVAVVVAFIFAAILFGLQLVIGQTQPLMALLISAGVSALVFRPLRNGVQRVVDRYIYRLRFDLNELNQVQKGRAIQNPGALTGRTLGSYEVLDLIGKGGMGEVYKAVGDGQTVAIKTLLTEKSADAELLQRFQREAAAGMALDHPNIARVRAIDSQDGLIYMVMDYLDGQDLSQKLKETGKLDSETVTELVTDLVEALAVAHGDGLVHRDIKPSNVMLVLNEDNETYRAVLMDFGVTKMKDANTLTGTGAIGTIDYMAPEQIVNAREVDPRADIYSLGIMMYEMVIGERPFKGNAGQVLFAHIQQPAPDPRDADNAVPRPLAKAILKSLEKDPDNRYQSIHELAAALG